MWKKCMKVVQFTCYQVVGTDDLFTETWNVLMERTYVNYSVHHDR